MRCTLSATLAFALALAATPAIAEEPPFYGPQLEGFTYPHPVQRFEFDSQQQKLSMAYMDVAATAEPNGRTVLLLHGKKDRKSTRLNSSHKCATRMPSSA